MKYLKQFMIIVSLILAALSAGCSGAAGGLKALPEPEEGKIIIIGAMLLENIDMGLSFNYWDWPIEVTLMGKDRQGNVSHYSVRTDREGYYIFSNLPTGSYSIKAITFQKPGDLPNIIVNKWNSATDGYYLMKYPEEGINYETEWFPSASDDKIIDNGIIWFGLMSERIADMSSESRGRVSIQVLREKMVGDRVWDEGQLITRDTPLDHFTAAYPESMWWK